MNSSLVPTTRWNWMQSLASILSLLICVCFPAVSSAQSLTLGQELAARDQAEQISEYVREVFQDREGNFWFGTNGDGVCRYDGKSLTYLSVEEGFGGRAVRGILQDSDGVMWFATNGGVSRYEAGIFTNYTEAHGLSDNQVWSIMLDSAGTIWVGTHGGVCRFDGESFIPFPLPRVEVENPKSRFSPKVVFGMFEDQVGNLWFGTDGEGAHMYDGKSFTSYTQKDGLAGNVVRCIQGDRHGRIWIGTNGDGVSCYDGTTFRNFTKKDGLNNDRIYEILEDRAGNMWFSTLGAGACRYDGKSFTAFREDYSLMINDYPARGHVQEFFEDRDGILWIGCSGGLFYLNGESFINVTRNGPWPVSAKSTTDVQEPVASPPSPTITTAQQAVAQKRAQTLRGDSEFRTLHNPVISADGAWMAAEERSDRGDGNVRVWSTERDLTFTIERGQNPRISRDSRWVSALQKPPLEDSRTAKPKNQRAGQTLVLLDTQDGSRRTFDFVLSYEWTYTSSYLIYLQSPETKADEEKLSKDKATKPAAKPTTGEREEGTLHMVYLKGDNVHTIENVAQHVTHQTHANHQTVDLVAYVMRDEQTARDTLHIAAFKPGPNTGYRGKHVSDKIKGLRWAHDDAILAFLDNTETTGKDGKPRVSSALYTWSEVPSRSGFRVFTRVDRVDSEFGALHNPVISADGAWVAAEERSDRGDGNVRVWSTEGDKTFNIECGVSPRISRGSRWVSAFQKPPLEKTKTAKPKNERAGQTLVLLDTQDGSRRTFEHVLSYDVTYSSRWLVYLQSPEKKVDEEGHSIDEATKPATKPATKERTVGTLHIVHLESDRVVSAIARGRMVSSMENVAQLATHQTTDHFAYVSHDEETGRDTLYIIALGRTGGWGYRGTYEGEKIEGLCWVRGQDGPGDGRRQGRMITVGFLDSTETTGKDGKRRVNSALYTWHVTGPNTAGKFTRVDTPQ